MTEGPLRMFSPSRSDNWLTLLPGVHEVFVALETECFCKFVSLVMFVPGEHYIIGALQAQSSSAHSSSTYEGWILRSTVYWAGSGAFLQVCRLEGSLDASRESGKCQVVGGIACGSKPIPKQYHRRGRNLYFILHASSTSYKKPRGPRFLYV